MPALDLRREWRFSFQALGGLLLALSFLCGYGAFSEGRAKLELRSGGRVAVGRITGYERRGLRSYPLVRFRTPDRGQVDARSTDSFLPLTAPSVGSPARIYYDELPPNRLLLTTADGFAQFAWMVTPAVLAFLSLTLLLAGLWTVLSG